VIAGNTEEPDLRVELRGRRFLQPLPAGSYTLVVLTDGQMTDSRPILVQAPSSSLSLLDRRFTVSATWRLLADGLRDPAVWGSWWTRSIL
jgi:hypothetical protein